jgi:hypothetical protein
MTTKTIYQVSAEATSPSGVQIEWKEYGLVSDSYEYAMRQCDHLNETCSRNIIGGVYWDVYWVVIGTEVDERDYIS